MSHRHPSPALRETDWEHAVALPRPRNISPPAPVESFPFTARTCARREMCTRRYGHAICKILVVVGCSTPQHLRSAPCSCQLICVQRALSLCGMSSTHSSVRAAGVGSSPACPFACAFWGLCAFLVCVVSFWVLHASFFLFAFLWCLVEFLRLKDR